jgi:phosphopantetheinyl transferase
LNVDEDQRYLPFEMPETYVRQTVPPPGSVDLWTLSLSGDVEGRLHVLSVAERARYARRRGTDARRFAIAHAAMREVLGQYLGCTPAQVPLSARYGEAPRTRRLHLSLSHSEELGLLAVSEAAVGVDVEDAQASDNDDLTDVAALTLSPQELSRLARVSAADRPRTWLQAWTRREAVLKARPGALDHRAISELDVSENTVLDLHLEDLDVGPKYVAALASGVAAPNVVWRELTDEHS